LCPGLTRTDHLAANVSARRSLDMDALILAWMWA